MAEWIWHFLKWTRQLADAQGKKNGYHAAREGGEWKEDLYAQAIDRQQFQVDGQISNEGEHCLWQVRSLAIRAILGKTRTSNGSAQVTLCELSLGRRQWSGRNTKFHGNKKDEIIKKLPKSPISESTFRQHQWQTCGQFAEEDAATTQGWIRTRIS